MKRFFSIMILLLLVTTSVMKAENTVTETINTTVDSTSAAIKANSLTFLTLYEDLKVGVTSLATALKVPAEHVYSVLIKQQAVKSITGLVMFILTLTGLFVSSYYGLPWASKHCDDSDGGSYILPVLGILVSAVIAVFILFDMDIIMTGLLNPEYGAIQDIVKMIK